MGLILITHILTGSVNLVSCAIAWFYPTVNLKKSINVLTFASLGSGIMLTTNPGYLTRAYCAKLGVYILFIATTQSRQSRTLAALPDKISA